MSAAATDRSAAGRRSLGARIVGLYALTPDLANTADLCARVEAAIRGGAAAIQYRNKSADAALRRAQAAALARRCAARGVPFIVNDDPALAADVGADGVHLGEDDGSTAAARRHVGADRIIGVSCYDDLARAEAAVAAGADYVAFGSFHASGVKPGARRATPALLARARSLAVPVVAIGGITAATAPQLLRAGAAAVAVITAVFAAGDADAVEAAARELRMAIDRDAR
jgi:thiamine-phosphate pyrophosphorylase